MRARFWVIIFVGFSFFAGSFCEARAQKEEIEQDTIWDQDRVVDRTITIKQGVELKIKQGTRVRFEKEGSMNVQGDLTIAGEKEKPVIFYQEEDKQQDGERRAYYLFFGPDSNSKISHFIFRDAGGYFEGGSKMPGMRVKGQLEITDSLITENTWAIEVWDSGRLKMRNCEIYDNNQTWGIEVKGSLAQADVINNYWGHDSGPKHETLNSEASGERIKGENIEFEPWLEKGRRPVVLVPGFGESLNLSRLLRDESQGEWKLFPSKRNTTALKEMFENAGYEQDRDLFIAYYDWRKPAAESVERDIMPVIKRAREISGFSETEIVAFSYGGIVARSYIQGSNYNWDVNRLITLGTPHKGASKIYPFCEGGVLPADWSPMIYIYLWFKQMTSLQLGLDFIRSNFPSAYEIFPDYDFLLDLDTGEIKDVRRLVILNETLDNLNKEVYKLSERVQGYFIGGTGFLTVDKVKVRDYWTADTPWERYWQDGIPDPFFPERDSDQGDGTVVLGSSVWEAEGVSSTELLAEHGDLPVAAKDILARILGIELEGLREAEFKDKYLIFAFPAGISAEILDKSGKRLSGAFSEIAQAEFFYQDSKQEALAFIYAEDEEYKVRVKGGKDGDFRFLVMDWNGQERKQVEILDEIKQDQEIDYIVKRDEQSAGVLLEIKRAGNNKYRKVAGEIRNFYQNRSLKSWEARQELLSVVFRGYNFSKNSEKEKEDEAIEQLRLRIDDLILAGQLAVASGDWLKGL